MDKKVFPGAPEGFNMVFSKKIFDVSLKLVEHDTEMSLKLAEIYQALSLCLIAPRAYYDLFMRVGPYYKELHDYWNNEVFIKNGGVPGSGQLFLRDANTIGLSTEILNEVPSECFQLLMGLLSFSQDPKVISDLPDLGSSKEQMVIFNQLVWAIYIGTFKSDFMEKNLEVFMQSGKDAQKELNASRKDLN